MNWGQAKAYCTTAMHRSDLTWDSIQVLAAADLSLMLQVEENQAFAAVTLTGPGGTGLCSGSLPADYFAMRSVAVGSDTLDPVDIRTLQDSGSADHYAVAGRVLLMVAPATANIVYTTQIPAFASDTDTSTILTNYPQVWIYALLKHAAIITQDPEIKSEFFDEQLRGAVTTANGAYLDQAFGPGMASMPMGGIV